MDPEVDPFLLVSRKFQVLFQKTPEPIEWRENEIEKIVKISRKRQLLRGSFRDIRSFLNELQHELKFRIEDASLEQNICRFCVVSYLLSRPGDPLFLPSSFSTGPSNTEPRERLQTNLGTNT